MSLVRPFTISFPDTDLDDLKRRIEATRWPEPEVVDDWTQGTPLAYVQELAEYWANSYDWVAAESRLNTFDHFLTEIDGVDIHFIHQRSPEPNAVPLLITHGWPGSIIEFEEVIGPLTNPSAHGAEGAIAFDVVAPSLPGFGFSGKPSETGWGIESIAEAWEELMSRLGYDGYFAQGGDWGSAVTSEIGRLQGNCAAIHLNMPIGRPGPDDIENPTDEEKDAFAALTHYQDWDSGYSKQQSTRPQSLGYGLTDSPVGQLAWIVEKFWAWTDCDGHPENAIPRDRMLDNITIYWLTATATSSARLYWESFGRLRSSESVRIPTGVAAYPKEILKSSRRWCERAYNIVHWTKMDKGGHFAALEQPESFVDDVRLFFSNHTDDLR